MKLALTLLLFCAQSFASDYLVPLPPGCTVSGKTQLSGSCDAAVPVPVPTSACPIIPNSAGGSFKQYAGPQKVYTDSGMSAYKTVDVGSFDALFGAWPGVYGLIDYFNLPTNSYLSMKFTIPANYMTAADRPNPLYGAYESGETHNDANYSITISTNCGDFSNPATNPTSSVVPGCYRDKLQTKGLLQWNSGGSVCKLENNKTYFLNFINADISQVHPGSGSATSTKSANCETNTCRLPIYNGPGTWGGYRPQP